jgi:hypothetical protein
LTNPCIRAALFGPIATDDPGIGHLVETALVSQLVPLAFVRNCFYARWKKGEVDLVFLDIPRQKVLSAWDVKWSDRIADRPKESLQGLLNFCRKNRQNRGTVLDKTVCKRETVDGIELEFRPVATQCYRLAANAPFFGIKHRASPLTAAAAHSA